MGLVGGNRDREHLYQPTPSLPPLPVWSRPHATSLLGRSKPCKEYKDEDKDKHKYKYKDRDPPPPYTPSCVVSPTCYIYIGLLKTLQMQRIQRQTTTQIQRKRQMKTQIQIQRQRQSPLPTTPSCVVPTHMLHLYWVAQNLAKNTKTKTNTSVNTNTNTKTKTPSLPPLPV